jgi:hypothetical protein
MFSTTTMASSTTKPVATVSAISDRLSMLKPSRYMTPKVPISDTGTATLGMNVERQSRRKTKTTRITSRIEMISVISTSCTEARMVVVESITTCIWIAGEIEAWSCGSTARMRSTVAITFAPGWRKMISRMAGLPLARPPERRFSTESSTVATSPRRTPAPFL